VITVKPGKDNKAVFTIIGKLPRKMELELSNALYEIGRENVKHLRTLFKAKDKTGRTYLIDGRRHRASAPGEAPASRTGRLARTAGYTVRGTSQVEFGDKAPYGLFLETGTRSIEPRPHIEATVEAKQRDTRISLEAAQNRALGGRR
jgi:hypothetical protein